MSKSPAFYKALLQAYRYALDYELSLPDSRDKAMRIAYLRNGFTPDRFLQQNQTEYTFYNQENTHSYTIDTFANDLASLDKSNQPLTDLELHTYDTYFKINPNKICGTQQGGTGYSFPVRTIGSIQDIVKTIDATLNTKPKTTKVEPNQTLPDAKKIETLVKSYGWQLENNQLINKNGKTVASIVYNKNRYYVLDEAKNKITSGNISAIEKAIKEYWFATKVESTKPAQKTESKYFICQFGELVNQPHAKPLTIKGFEEYSLFICKGYYHLYNPGEVTQELKLLKEDRWGVVEATTGVSIISHNGSSAPKTQAEAIKIATEILNKQGKENINKALSNDKNRVCIGQPKPKNPLTLYKYKAKAIALKLKLSQQPLSGVFYYTQYQGAYHKCKVLDYNYNGSNTQYLVEVHIPNNKKVKLIRNKQDVKTNNNKAA